MRQKIYAKFTKERVPQFQIETGIYEEDGKYFILKRALHPEGAEHVRRLFDNYRYFEEKLPGCLAEVRERDGMAEFAFIKGESLAKRLDDAAAAGDKEGLLKLLADYRKLTRSLVGELRDYAPEENALFGNYPELAGVPGAYRVNADLTFDNILYAEDGSRKVIDYEWIFDCVLPLDFPVYRAVFAYYLRSHNGLDQLLSIEECRKYLDITEEAWKCYEQMNEAFNAYIMGGEKGYGSILSRYARKNLSLEDILAWNEETAQLYVDRGAGYSEADSIRQRVEVDGSLNVLELTLTGEEKAVRMDPMNAGGLVELTEAVLVEPSSGKLTALKLTSNGEHTQGGRYLFMEEDPQFTVKLKKNRAGNLLRFTYRIISRFTDHKA